MNHRGTLITAGWLAACTSAGAIAGCGEGEPERPGQTDGVSDGCAFEPGTFDSFDQAVSVFLADHGLAGASAAVVHERCGSVHVQGYGAHASDRLYLMASASKVPSAGILLRLADRGLLDLDAPIGQYLAAPGGKPELTVAMLVSNSSGLIGLVDNPLYAPYRCQYQAQGSLGDCALTIYTADDSADRAAPDSSFHYGGGQWQLAGGIAEAVSGLRWDELVEETYRQPCGLRRLGYTNPFGIAVQTGGLRSIFDYPAFFQADTRNLPASDNPSVEGGLFSDVSEYGRLLLMHLRGGECDVGRVLSESSATRMRFDRILEAYSGSTAGQAGRTAGGDSGAFAGYGLGWWIDREHPGVFADPGLYGSFPWLDLPRGYGAIIALEADGTLGAQLWASAKPALDRVFDARR